ncbi:hypothetical protein [Micromonospora sp. DT47]|uniref:hypothetical protein n=1 Tax=Micromonospora sp. DT47 TaxID=3393431 RepID=UPI003CE75B9D
MSPPISAMISWAARMPIPVISSNLATAAAKGTIISSIRLSQLRDVRGEGVDTAQHGGADERVMVVEVAGQRLTQLGDLAAHRGVRQLGEYLRVPLAGDHRLQHFGRHAGSSHRLTPVT